MIAGRPGQTVAVEHALEGTPLFPTHPVTQCLTLSQQWYGLGEEFFIVRLASPARGDLERCESVVKMVRL